MALLTKVGTFEASTSTGNQSITGVGFTPKALILWTAGSSSFDTDASHFASSIGIAHGPGSTEQFAHGSSAFNGSSSSAYIRQWTLSGYIVAQRNNSSTEQRRASLASFDADGFTLNWNLHTNGSFDVFHYMVLGGDEVLAHAALSQTPSGSGSVSTTGVGFEPSAIIAAAMPTTSVGTLYLGCNFIFGAADADGNQWSVTGARNDASTNNWHDQRNDRVLYLETGSDSVFLDGMLTSMDPDGFTINWIDATSDARSYMTLAIGGVDAKAGVMTKTTDAAPVSQSVTGLGMTPDALILASDQDVSPNPQGANEFSFGFSLLDGTNAAASRGHGYSITTGNRSSATDAFLKANPGTGTDDAVAGSHSFGSDQFTLDWTTNDAVATTIGYLAFGSGVTHSELNQSDADVLGVTETRSASGWATRSTSAPLGLTELASIYTTSYVQRSDADALSVLESQSIVGTMGSSESRILTVTEVPTLLAYPSRSDAFHLQANESPSIFGSVTRSDADTMSISEASDLFVSVVRSDNNGLFIAESSDLASSVDTGEALALGVTETISSESIIAIDIDQSDTLALGFSESADIGTFTFASSADTIAVGSSDTPSMTRQTTSHDHHIAISESRAATGWLADTMTAALGALEERSALGTMVSADTGLLSTSTTHSVSAYSLGEDEEFLTISEVTDMLGGPFREMTYTLSATEAADLLGVQGDNDGLAIIGQEDSTVYTSVGTGDASVLSVTESRYVTSIIERSIDELLNTSEGGFPASSLLPRSFHVTIYGD